MKKSVSLVAAMAALLIPMVCSAAPPQPGPYVSGFIGATFPRDADVTTDDFLIVPARTFSDTVEFDPGINVGGTGGYDFGFVRLEGELSYKFLEMDKINEVSPAPTSFHSIDGDLGVLAVMANAFVDFHNPSPITPYVGGGIGFAAMHLNDTFGTTPSGGRKFVYSEGDDTVFAYQVGGGMEIALNRRLSLDLAYRYFGTNTATFDDDPTRTTEFKYESHNATVGVRVKF